MSNAMAAIFKISKGSEITLNPKRILERRRPMLVMINISITTHVMIRLVSWKGKAQKAGFTISDI